MGCKPPGIKDIAFYDVFNTLCGLILPRQNIVILGDYNCDFMVDTALKDICETLIYKIW